MKTIFSYAIALVFSLSLTTAAFAAPASDGTIYCGDHEKGKKVSKKGCKEKCSKNSASKKGCCSKNGSTSKK